MAWTAEQHRHEARKHGTYATLLWVALAAELVFEGAADLVTGWIVPLLGIEIAGEGALDIGTAGLATIETAKSLYHGYRYRRLTRGPRK